MKDLQGRYLMANHEFLRVFGRSHEESHWAATTSDFAAAGAGRKSAR